MSAPTTIADLSTTASSNSPQGGEAIGTGLSNYLRSIQAIIKSENSRGADVASSTTLIIPSAGRYFVVTGNTAITSIADSWNGRAIVIEFSGSPVLTNSAGLVLPGAANITAAPGDCASLVNESTGVWRCVSYLRCASTAPLQQIDSLGNWTLPGTLRMGSQFGNRNKIIGHFDINQRTLTSVANDAYCCDRWYVLTESGSVNIGQITEPESGAPYAIRLTQPDVNAKRMGLATIIESKDICQFRSAAMNFYMRVKPSFSGNVRYAIIEHTGTQDVVTSDVVNNWSSTSFTAGNFFISGINIIKTGTVAPGAGVYGEFSDYGTFGPSLNNVILFVWSETPQVQNTTLELNRPQLEPGVIHTPHEWRQNELALCQRYYQAGNWEISGYQGVNNGAAGSWISWKSQMRAAPTCIVSRTGGGTNFSSLSFNSVTADGGCIYATINPSGAYDIAGVFIATAEL